MSSGNIFFGQYLINDNTSKYWLYFKDTFGTTGATIIDDSNGIPITGLVSGRTNIDFTFDYTGNTQQGRIPNTDCNYTSVAIGINSAKYYTSDGIINSGNTNIINMMGDIDWNYGSSGYTGTSGTSGSSGKNGEIGSLNLDGGYSGTIYGGTTRINGGSA